MSGRLSLIGQNQPMLNPSNFGAPLIWGPGAICPSAPLSAALLTAMSLENTDTVHKHVLEDRRISTVEIAEKTGLSWIH